MSLITRRSLLIAGAGGLVAGCDRIGNSAAGRDLLFKAEAMHKSLQRAITDRNALAREFAETDMSPRFRANGSLFPADPAYRTLMRGNFADWRLKVDGLVSRPLSLSLADRGFVLSDHADWNDILVTISKVKPTEVWTNHGNGMQLKQHFADSLVVKMLN